jgi:hypothetical protein
VRALSSVETIMSFFVGLRTVHQALTAKLSAPSRYGTRSSDRSVRSPITSTVTRVSASTSKEQHLYNDNQDQFHGKSTLIVLALRAAHCILQSTDRVLHLAGSSFGLLCPLIRSLSIADILVIYSLGVYGTDLI